MCPSIMNSYKGAPVANGVDKPPSGSSEEILIAALSLPPNMRMSVVNADETTLYFTLLL